MGEFRVEGRVVDRARGQGMAGLRVEAWDKDLVLDDHVGTALTTATGEFTIVFDESRFAGLTGERFPDLFFRIYAGARLLRSTGDAVLWNTRAGTTPVRLEVDMDEAQDGSSAAGAAPVEIPWQLSASSQDAAAAAAYDSTVSLFHYEPRLDALAAQYPRHRLLYLRVSASISPIQPDEASFAEPVAGLLAGGLPVMQAIVDLRVRAAGTGDKAAPHFVAASPTRRTMVETGVVGAESFEGESNGLSIGKSASQMHETASAHATSETKKTSGGVDLLIASAGWSTHSTNSSLSSERTVQQDLQVMNRNATSERRDLASHMSRVENILTLLTAKHIGSPFLRFALMPRPLATLSADASDPNLWYSQLLRRRSSGIEGLQDFHAVLAVPHGTTQCTVTATLQRIGVLDNPPDPPQTGWREYTWDRWLAMHAYLSRTYPRGTPIEELDVDLQLDPAKFRRPIVLDWSPGVPDELGYEQQGRDVIVYVGDFDTHPGDAVAIRDYKRVEEVALQMYEEDLARSPLERGVVLAQEIELTVGFECSEAGVLPTTHHTRLSPAAEREFTPAVPPTPPYLRRHRGPTSAPYQHVHTATNWNLLERQLASTVANTTAPPFPSGRSASRRLLRRVLERLARLAIDDTRNVGLEKAAAALGLSREQAGHLAMAGVTDLRGLAQALWRAAHESEIATQVTRLNEARAAAHREAVKRPAPPLGAEAAQALLDRLAKTVLGRPRATREAR